MSKHDSVEKVVAKLHVLRDSCTGVLNSQRTNPHLLWFKGAEAVLSESVDELQKLLHSIESGAEEKPAVAEEVREEALFEETESEEDKKGLRGE